jgi:hypothetical protein
VALVGATAVEAITGRLARLKTAIRRIERDLSENGFIVIKKFGEKIRAAM